MQFAEYARTGPAGFRAVLAVHVLVACLAASALAPQEAGAADFAPDDGPTGPEPILLVVRMDGSTLGVGLACRVDEGRVRIPLGALCTLLDLAIQVEGNGSGASGFFIREDRSFRLDFSARTVDVETSHYSFDSTQVESIDGDLLVDTAALASWLPIDLAVDLYASVLTIRPREPLPLQARRRRRMEIERNLRELGILRPAYPETDTPYRIFGPPFLDPSLTLQLGSAGTLARLPRVDGSTYLTMNLLYTEAGMFVSRSGSDGATTLRLHASRRTPDGEGLGPFRVREATVGDIAFPGLDMVVRAGPGPGILLTNRPPGQPTQFDRHTFTGDLPAGWEVELYRNGTLLGYEESGGSGRYVFEDVPLLFGPNTFREAFYGPQGQHREELESYAVGMDLTPPGRSNYLFALKNAGSPTGERTLLEWNMGLSRRISAAVSVAGAREATGQRRYGTLALRGFSRGVLGGLDVGIGPGGSGIGRVTAQTRIGPLGIHLRHAALDRFRSEALGTLGGSGSRTTLRLDAVARLSRGFTLPMVLEMDHSRQDGGRTLDQVHGSVAWSRRGFSVTEAHHWSSTSDALSLPRTESRGNLFLTEQSGRLGLRGELGYSMKPSIRSESMALSAEYRVSSAARLGAGLNHSVAHDRYFLAYQRGTGPFNIGIQGSYIPRGGATLSVTLSAGLAPEPRSGTWRSTARPQAGYGAASARVFLDSDGNGLMEPGEEPLEGVGLILDSPAARVLTDANGVAFLDHLAGEGGVNLSISPGTLQNPLWIAERSGVRLTPRVGLTSLIEFPVAMSGEVTGTVRRSGPRAGVASGIELHLLDAGTDTLVRRTVSDYDGFYDLGELRPGRYRLVASSQQLARLGLVCSDVRDVEITAAGTILEGVDFRVDARHRPALVLSPAPSPALRTGAGPGQVSVRTPRLCLEVLPVSLMSGATAAMREPVKLPSLLKSASTAPAAPRGRRPQGRVRRGGPHSTHRGPSAHAIDARAWLIRMLCLDAAADQTQVFQGRPRPLWPRH